MDTLLDKRKNGMLIAAHRGSSGGNVPCNSKAAFGAALLEKADIIELDVSVSHDGTLFVFHPGMEHAHIGTRILLSARNTKSVEALRFVNQDNTKTSYPVMHLGDALRYLKGKCYINIDKFWTAPEQITAEVRRCGVEEQIIIKTNENAHDFNNVEKYAPDLAFMPVISHKDRVTHDLAARHIHLIGAEVLFASDDDEVCSKEFIDSMHERGLMVWGNSIVYDERSVISAGHTDDCAVCGNPENGWGWFRERSFDIIQTDWAGLCRQWLQETNG